MDWLIALVVGLISGTHTSTWGMYKDSPHEGFTWPKYSRSILLAGVLAVLAQAVLRLDLRTGGGLFVLFGLTYVLERACTEFYKTFLREEDQSKYFIPMQFAVRGKVVKSRGARLAVGAGVAAAALALAAVVYFIERSLPGEPGLPVILLVGGLGGWFSAFGGAWKDAPIEGFETLKFFRSPVIATLYALLLSNFTDNLFVIPLAALGYTIATLETYKTFFFPSKPRGKFANKPVTHPEMLTRRNRFVPVYVGIWLAVATVLLLGLTR